MLWGSTWNIMTHVGVSPMCLCCCNKDEGNPGGEQFTDRPVHAVRTRPREKGTNPFLRVDLTPSVPADISIPDPSDKEIEFKPEKEFKREFSDKAQRSAGLKSFMSGLTQAEQHAFATDLLADEGIELVIQDEERLSKDCFCELLLLLIAADEI